ncbi:uncharacterized protein HMPREF1541_06077 [Cyphellophora europaea CBS 101466]|uniref:SGNH hydrolase-type esterase domain-containing protein n=1 Tax=Cyphellophora europaea (strain CBS 101466) TaxID=1220924 RepID=W2RTM3_CYPE1|nr:uncharacterized protein HMPREF1541_06077 [Cyphellophora europaea CBS 101466]ETN39851.1 hypothetical protein HMPREF1541_06077 [Cyphellophora europaea CBS 101466]
MTTIPHPHASPSTQQQQQPYPQLILFGDSITQGAHSTLIPRLSELYLRRADIINRGFSGYNTIQAIPLLPLLFPPSGPSHPRNPSQPRVALLTVFFGANDAVLPGNAQHVSLSQYATLLHRIVTDPAIQQHDTKVLLLTPPPVDEHQSALPLQRTAANTKLYADACAAVAHDLRLPLVDVWSTFMRQAGWDPSDSGPLVGSREAEPSTVLRELLSDGLHLTEKGYAAVFEELWRVVREEVPEMLPERLPMVVPEWKEVMGVED